MVEHLWDSLVDVRLDAFFGKLRDEGMGGRKSNHPIVSNRANFKKYTKMLEDDGSREVVGQFVCFFVDVVLSVLRS